MWKNTRNTNIKIICDKSNCILMYKLFLNMLSKYWRSKKLNDEKSFWLIKKFLKIFMTKSWLWWHELHRLTTANMQQQAKNCLRQVQFLKKKLKVIRKWLFINTLSFQKLHECFNCKQSSCINKTMSVLGKMSYLKRPFMIKKTYYFM